MTLTVSFRRAARAELEEAISWYESQRDGLGAALVREVEDALDVATRAPQRFPIVLRDVRRVALRRFPYAIYFRVRAERLIVLAIFHGRRDPRIWQARV